MDKLKSFLNHPRIRQLLDVRNIGLYIFGLIVLSVSWSGIKVIQTNYSLQKQIATLEQQVSVQELENGNLKLKTQYYQTDQFKELAARRQFGLALPGERLVIIPKEVAMQHATAVPNPFAAKTSSQQAKDNRPQWQQNGDAWFNFYFHPRGE